MRHYCHVPGCEREVKREKLMCPHHWAMVPNDIQDAVYASYRPGQCDSGRPSVEWLKAARHAITAVRKVTSRETQDG